MGEPVIIGLQLYSRYEQPVLVSRLHDNEFVTFKLVGPDGNDVPWQRKAAGSPRAHAASDFTTLSQYQAVSVDKTISLQNGTGFALNKPGEYTLTAEFSIAHPEALAQFEAQSRPVVGTIHSSKLMFCIEACLLSALSVRNDAPQSALEAVRLFYTNITQYRQLGIPYGRAKKALWPLMSKRLAQEIDDLGKCDKNYYRLYRKNLRFKPTTPWLEVGLFTGPDDAATPSRFRILGSRSVGGNRVDVLLGFKEDWGETEGDVTAILENHRWVVDDYVAMYGNDDLIRLSSGYSQCEDGRWVVEPVY